MINIIKSKEPSFIVHQWIIIKIIKPVKCKMRLHEISQKKFFTKIIIILPYYTHSSFRSQSPIE